MLKVSRFYVKILLCRERCIEEKILYPLCAMYLEALCCFSSGHNIVFEIYLKLSRKYEILSYPNSIMVGKYRKLQLSDIENILPLREPLTSLL